jgi:hypothetical protein
MSLTPEKPFLTLDIDVGPLQIIGDTGGGVRRFVPILGGRVRGDLTGEILPGADWQIVDKDGNLEIDAHYALRTAAGQIIEVSSLGVRTGPPAVLARLAAGEAVDASQYYFRTAVRFKAAAPALRHLNHRLAVARGERRQNTVVLEVFEVL